MGGNLTTNIGRAARKILQTMRENIHQEVMPMTEHIIASQTSSHGVGEVASLLRKHGPGTSIKGVQGHLR